MLKLSIIILSYNTKDLTTDCMKSLFDFYQEEFAQGIFEVILVDNASSDNTAEAIVGDSKLSLFKDSFKVIKSAKNLGFAKGCNLGAKKAKGKYLLFLNSDTRVLDKGLNRMVSFMSDRKDAGILGGRLFDPDMSVQKTCGRFYTLPNLVLMLAGIEKIGILRFSPKAISRVDWVSGACMMVRAEIFKKLNGFDEKFFMYVEDMEFCFRAKNEGLPVYFYPDLCIIHASHASSNKAFAIVHIYEGLLYFYKKHMPSWQYDIAESLLREKANILSNLGNQVYAQALEIFKR